MTDKYTKVECILIHMSSNAALIGIAKENGMVLENWIPLSLVHGADEIKMRRVNHIDKITIRVMDWKVKELGL